MIELSPAAVGSGAFGTAALATLVPDLDAWKQLAAVLGAGIMSAFLAWRAGRRKTIHNTPYTPELDEQPRILTRKEAHGLIDILNVWDHHKAKVKDLDRRMTDVERHRAEDRHVFDEHVKGATAAMTTFLRLEADFHAFRRQWDEAGVHAREDRQEVRDDILFFRTQLEGLSKRIDDVLRLSRG